MSCLENQALGLAPAATGLLYKGSASSMLKDLPDTLARLGTAFQVADSTDLGSNRHTFFGGHRALAGLAQFLNDLGVVTKIFLATDKNDGQVLAEVKHLRDPFFLDIVETVRGVNGKADKDHMRVRVGKRAQTVVVLLAGGIPQGKLNMTAIHFDIGHVVLKDSRHIHLVVSPNCNM